MPCLAPSEILTDEMAQAVGGVAERLIQSDYLRIVGRTVVFPIGTVDFFDPPEEFGNRKELYAAFLSANHPALTPEQLAIMSGSGLLKIPDIMTNDPPGRTEFYEIKPNSTTGRQAGREKVANIDAARQSVHLPYTPGVQFPANAADNRVRLYSAKPLGVQLDVYLRYDRTQDGLLLYQVCAEGDLAQLGLEMLKRLLAAILIVVAIRLRIRVPIPVPGVLT